jgi:hypothetical protein
MRSETDRLQNTPFLVFTVEVDGRDKPFKAQALSMADAAKWCPLAAEFNARMQTPGSYDGLAEAGIDVLKAYPRIEQRERVNWDGLTFEQVVHAVNALYEINDPFQQAQSIQMAKLAAMGERMSDLRKAGLDLSKFMPSQTASE